MPIGVIKINQDKKIAFNNNKVPRILVSDLLHDLNGLD